MSDKFVSKQKDKKDLGDWMTLATVIFAIVCALGLTAVFIWFNHDMTPIDFFGAIFGISNAKITAAVTANIFTGLVAFGFLGALIMLGVRKIVFHFVKKSK